LPDKNDFIAIGRIVKPIGVKGNVKAIYLTDFPDRFNSLSKVFLFDERKEEFRKNYSALEFNISDCKPLNGYVNLKFEGYEDKNSVSELIGQLIMIPETERVKLPEDNFYFYDLIGSEVFDNGKRLGTIESFTDFGSGDLVNINIGGKTVMIPFRKEFVKKVDVKNKRVDLELIEGFLE